MFGKSVKAGLLGFARPPMVFARGTRSCKSCRRLASRAMPSRLTPVTFPPGRLRDATSPPFTASELDVNTIGIFGVAAFCGPGHSFATGGRNDSNGDFDKLRNQHGQPVIVAVSGAAFDRHVLSDDETGLFEALAKRRHQRGPLVRRGKTEIADDWLRLLLCVRNERKRRR